MISDNRQVENSVHKIGSIKQEAVIKMAIVARKFIKNIGTVIIQQLWPGGKGKSESQLT
jgi:hypothetical protein